MSRVLSLIPFHTSRICGKDLFMNAGWSWAKDITDDQNTGSGFSGQLIENAYNRSVARAGNVLTRTHRVLCERDLGRCRSAADQAALSSSPGDGRTIRRLEYLVDLRGPIRAVLHSVVLQFRYVEYEHDRRPAGSHRERPTGFGVDFSDMSTSG